MFVGFKVVCGQRSFRPATKAALQRIRYRIGEMTAQENDHGPFALFASLADARRFAARHGDLILMCEYVESDETELWKKGIPEFHKSLFRGGSPYATATPPVCKDLDSCPNGTVLARFVLPFLRVNEWDPDDLCLVDPDESPSVIDGDIVFDAEGSWKRRTGT